MRKFCKRRSLSLFLKFIILCFVIEISFSKISIIKNIKYFFECKNRTKVPFLHFDFYIKNTQIELGSICFLFILFNFISFNILLVCVCVCVYSRNGFSVCFVSHLCFFLPFFFISILYHNKKSFAIF